MGVFEPLPLSTYYDCYYIPLFTKANPPPPIQLYVLYGSSLSKQSEQNKPQLEKRKEKLPPEMVSFPRFHFV